MSTKTAIPGQILGSLASHVPGAGTYIYEDNIHASLAGPVSTQAATKKSEKPTISVSRDNYNITSSAVNRRSSALPAVGSIVLSRVTRVQQRQLTASILIVDPAPSSVIPYTAATNDEIQFQAILRKEDVRAYEKDRVVMNEMFRVGDIVRAAVISLGDERNYYISTAGNEFGVVVAKSELGNPMVPASWKEMKDVVTGKGELRKVAKPV